MPRTAICIASKRPVHPQIESELRAYYHQVHHRKMRFNAHAERQRFESRFIRDIRKTFDPEGTGKTIVIFWGAWGKIAGRPGGVGNKGRAPTIGVGLAKRIAKEYGIVIVWTPEHMTTKKCHNCGGECDRDSKTEARRHKDRERREGRCINKTPKEIRGLKRCTQCSAFVNRDLNAAKNIATNGILLLHGFAPIAVHDEEQVEMLQLEAELQMEEE